MLVMDLFKADSAVMQGRDVSDRAFALGGEAQRTSSCAMQKTTKTFRNIHKFPYVEQTTVHITYPHGLGPGLSFNEEVSPVGQLR